MDIDTSQLGQTRTRLWCARVFFSPVFLSQVEKKKLLLLLLLLLVSQAFAPEQEDEGGEGEKKNLLPTGVAGDNEAEITPMHGEDVWVGGEIGNSSTS